MKIAANYVYTLESAAPLRDAYVEIDDSGTILKVGPEGSAGDADVVYEGALLPGFVNSHCHIELSHLKGKFRKGTGMAGFIDQINELRDCCTEDEKASLVEEWMRKLYDSGVSAMADISNGSVSFAAKAASPLYTRTFLEVFGSEPEDCPQVIAMVKELNRKADEAGIDAAPTPHSCYTMSPVLLEGAASLGLSRGFLSYHSQESHEEEEMMISGTGAMAENRHRAGMSMPPVTGKPSLFYFIDRLKAVSEIPVSGNVLLVHNVCLNQESIDAALKAMKNVYWAICPLSNIFIHNALPPVELMHRNNLKITLGTDSLSSNDDLDMIAELFCLQNAFPDIPLGEMFRWASRNGAEFLKKDDVLGTLEPGKKPGLVLVEHLDNDGRLTAGSSSRRLV